MIVYVCKQITKKSRNVFLSTLSVAKIPHELAFDPREVDVVCVVDREQLGLDFHRVLNFNSVRYYLTKLPNSYFLLRSSH
jgi:hypothetical protein